MLTPCNMSRSAEERLTGPAKFRHYMLYPYNRELVRGKLLVEPTGNPSIRLTALLADTDEAARAAFDLDTFDAYGDRISRVDQPSLATDNSDMFGARLDWRINDAWTVTSVTSFVNQDRMRIIDGDGSPAPVGVFSQTDDVESVTQELRLVYSVSDALEFLLGGFYADIGAKFSVAGRFPSQFVIGVPGATAIFSSRGEENTENYAFFAEAHWQVNEKLAVLGGFRYDDETVADSAVSELILEPPLFPLPPGAVQPTKTSYDAFLPKAQVVYDWMDTLSSGFTYQRGYRSGGATFNAFAAGNSLAFDAEFTNNYEIALRSEWLDRRLVLNANLYYIDWTDQQVTVPLLEAFPELASQLPPGIDTSTLTATVNAGESEVMGLELLLDYEVSANLNLFASMACQSTEFKDFPFPDSVEGDDNLAGNEFRFAPEWSWAMGVNYRHPRGLFINGNLAYQDGQYADNVNAPMNKSDSYILANIRAGFSWRQFTLSAFASNVFDEKYLDTREMEFNQAIGGTEQTYGISIGADF